MSADHSVVALRAGVVAAVALLSFGAVAGCTKTPDTTVMTTTSATPALPSPDSAAPGDLLNSEPLSPVDLRVTRTGATAQRITYRSTSGIDGSPRWVTGAVFTPRGQPPSGGWPVLAYAHSTLGILENCGPSQHPDLLGVAPQIELLLRQGYLVVMADYQGLGSAGPHPYLEPRTAGYNVIDSVRAARQLVRGTGTRWVAYGGSQGGQAAWAAAELAPSYGKGLDMVGAVALAPAADMSGLPTEAMRGEMSKNQLPLFQWIVNAVAAVEPGVQINDYIHGFALENNEALLQCAGPGLVNRNRLVFGLKPDNVRAVNDAANNRLTKVLTSWSLPLDVAPTSVPIKVVVGADDDMVAPAWTEAAVHRACERGENVDYSVNDGQGHDNIDYRPALAWLAERFRGVPAARGCPAPGGQPE